MHRIRPAIQSNNSLSCWGKTFARLRGGSSLIDYQLINKRSLFYQCMSNASLSYSNTNKNIRCGFLKHRDSSKFKELYLSTRRFSSTQRSESSAKMQQDYIVGHDESNKMFYITIQDKAAQGNGKGSLAKLDYDYVHPNLVDLYHTEVPPEYQGHGVAKLLAKAAFDHFCEKEIHFRPSCTYLAKYMKEHPIPRYLDYMDKSFKL